MKKNARDDDGWCAVCSQIEKKVNYTQKKRYTIKISHTKREEEQSGGSYNVNQISRWQIMIYATADCCRFGSSRLSLTFCLSFFISRFCFFLLGSFWRGRQQRKTLRTPKTQLQSQLQSVRNRKRQKPGAMEKSKAWFTRDSCMTGLTSPHNYELSFRFAFST